jgi:predicted amidohydrolase YtcJ
MFARKSAPAGVILLERHIFEIDPRTISDTKVVTTIVGGQDRL